jgi:hypothetical protein
MRVAASWHHGFGGSGVPRPNVKNGMPRLSRTRLRLIWPLALLLAVAACGDAGTGGTGAGAWTSRRPASPSPSVPTRATVGTAASPHPAQPARPPRPRPPRARQALPVPCPIALRRSSCFGRLRRAERRRTHAPLGRADRGGKQHRHRHRRRGQPRDHGGACRQGVQSVRLTLADGRRVTASVTARRQDQDLALLRSETGGLTPPPGRRDGASPGQGLLALGYARHPRRALTHRWPLLRPACGRRRHSRADGHAPQPRQLRRAALHPMRRGGGRGQLRPERCPGAELRRRRLPRARPGGRTVPQRPGRHASAFRPPLSQPERRDPRE